MNDHLHQQQFLNVVDRDEAERRFHAVLDLTPLDTEPASLAEALGRILAEDVTADVDVPGFDRSNVDGFALHSADTFGATEEVRHSLRLNDETLATGVLPRLAVAPGTATPIATGAMLPRGADAVVMIEYTDVVDDRLCVSRPVAPGDNITFAGTDVGHGELVLRRGDRLGSRDTGVLAALGVASVSVVRRPRVAILSTGDELVPPGQTIGPGQVYDSNATILADAVRELGGEPVPLGIVSDDYDALSRAVERGLDCDVLVLSGGTSKGAGDISYRVLENLGPPGIVAHGVALKPGKPLCLAAVARSGKRPIPVAVLPGFPTSAIFTFHEFLAPVIQRLAGRRDPAAQCVSARLPIRVNSERGRTEYLLVRLVSIVDSMAAGQPPWNAFPMGKGSGSVTTFSKADGFVVIPRQREYLEADETADVHLLDATVRPADLVVIGSHCSGLDYLLGLLHERGITTKVLMVGSTGGLEAAKRGECDLAGIHLLDPITDEYNRSFLTDNLTLIRGYGRMQGIVFRKDDVRFVGQSIADAVATALADQHCMLVNRNRGSGTRILIDQLLKGARPPGYLVEARSHNAVVAAVAQGRADWGVAIAPVANDSDLGFLALRAEHYDFVVPKSRRARPPVQAFAELLARDEIRLALRNRGFKA